jgi:DNA polymerase III epsilon subunit family exonuclease
MKTIFFDTETTGLNCATCQIIELAMIVVEDGYIVEEYDKFVKTDERLPLNITQITGITDDMLKEEGVSEAEIAEDLKNRMTPGTLMVAHNCQFDLSFVYYLLKRHYLDEADGIVRNVDWLDTLTVVKDRMEYPHRLNNAVEHYELEKVNFHRAIDDTRALYEVYKKLKYDPLYSPDEIDLYINLFGYNPKYPISGIRLRPKITYKPQRFHNFPDKNKRLPFEYILPNQK